MHRNTHVINHADDVFDLFRIDDAVREVIVDFAISEISLLFALCNQELELGLLLV